jgi:pilus assembly protein CpaE
MRVAAIMRSEESGRMLRQACSGINGTAVDIHILGLDQVARNRALIEHHDVLLLDVDAADPAQAAALGDIMQRQFPGKAVLVAAASITLDSVGQMMRLGVVDVLPQPLRQADLVIALDHAQRRKPTVAAAPGAAGKVITFIKGGCGIGATTLAVQGGCVLAAESKHDRRVCLMDLDLQFGTAGLYLDLAAGAGMSHLLETPERLDRALLRGAMARHASGLDVLLAPSEMVRLDAVSGDFVTACLDLARAEYSRVLVDLPFAWMDWTCAVLRQSDLIVLVTELTVAGVRQTLRQLETLRANGIDSAAIRLVLNRNETGWLVNKSSHIRDAEKALGRKFDFFISNDYALVSQALNRGQPLASIEKGSRVEKDLRAMYAGLEQALAPAPQAALAAVKASVS